MSLGYSCMRTLQKHGPPWETGRVGYCGSNGKGRGFGEGEARNAGTGEVIREGVQADVGHDLSDLGIPESGLPDRGDVGVLNQSSVCHQLPGEAEQHIGLRVGGRPSPTGKDFLLGQSHSLTKGTMSRYA